MVMKNMITRIGYRGIASLFAVLLIHTASAIAQTIQLSFTGKQAGQYIQLDSIRVENLTQSCDTSLYWPDTVLTLGYTAILEKEPFMSGFSLSGPVPQPFRDECSFELQLPVSGPLELTVYDQTGRRLHAISDQMAAGTHRFGFHSGGDQVYFVHARWESQVQTIRLVSAGSEKGRGSRLQYLGHSGTKSLMKVTVAINNAFGFTPGDTLLFLGFAAGDTAGFTAVPLGNAFYTFTFGEGHPCIQTPLISYGGQMYQTVQIGSQCWMRENLNIGFKVYSSISGLPHSDCSNNPFIEKYCINNDTAYCAIYGGLYDWDEMMGYSVTPGVKGICPVGWHIPTDEEWCVLTTFLDSSVNCTSLGFSGTNSGGKMKESGFAHWLIPNTGATNESGFTALAGGHRTSDGYFINLGNSSGFWSSTVNSSTNSNSRIIFYNNARVSRSNYHQATGLAVRCIRDF